MRNVRRLLIIAAALVGVALLLPSSVGGEAGYVRSYGNSMEPMFHAGDLAVIRTAARYHIGDVVAYRSPQLDRVVLHRIVGRDGNTFVFRGDNNDFSDAEHLGTGHILGKLLLRVPRAGTVLVWLTDPIHAAAVAMSASVVPAAVLTSRHRRRRPQPMRGLPMTPSAAPVARAISPWLAITGLVLVLAGGFALTRPTSQVVDRPVPFAQHGTFTYSAPSSSPLYADGFTTGDPVFTRLADRVVVELTHRVESDATIALDGTMAVDAILSGPGGWKRTVRLVEPRHLDGPETDVAMTLELSALRALADEAKTITGASAGEINIAVTATVDLGGMISGQAVDDRFEPTLAFTLDDIALRPVALEAGTDGTAVKDSAVQVPTAQAAVLLLPLPGPDPTVAHIRAVGLVGGMALLLLAGALAFAGRPRGDEPTRIAARYRRHLLTVHASDDQEASPAIEVTSIADLMGLAERYDRPVIHQLHDRQHTYVIELHGTAYRYAAPRSEEPWRRRPHDTAAGRRRRPAHRQTSGHRTWLRRRPALDVAPTLATSSS